MNNKESPAQPVGKLKSKSIMATKVILNADLYDNVLTEKPGDYVAKPRITGSFHNADIAAEIVKERTEYRPETIANILDLADKKKVEAIAAGKSLVDGVGQYLLSISGSFEGEQPRFNPEIHKVGITYTPGKLLLDALKPIDFNVQLATTGPVVNSVTDFTSGRINQTLTPGGPAILSGATLLLKGDNPKNGVYLTKDEASATPVKVALIIRNTTSEIILQLPALVAGQYKLSVTTQAGASYTILKDPRTYTFPILLTVGGESESPDEV